MAKVRESGMPEEAYWASFFDAQGALDRLLPIESKRKDMVEFGCGYGIFTIPAAQRTNGVVTALDIEPEMVRRVQTRAKAAGLGNVRAVLRDFIAEGTGLQDGSQSHAMIFNLLHLDDPLILLREAKRVLHLGGTVSVIHWRSDVPTPRGPPLAIRPTPQQCHKWMIETGFVHVRIVDLELCCPYHFGLVGRRGA